MEKLNNSKFSSRRIMRTLLNHLVRKNENFTITEHSIFLFLLLFVTFGSINGQKDI